LSKDVTTPPSKTGTPGFRRDLDKRYANPSSRQTLQQRKASPMPIGDSCNPLCPLFKCMRGALFVHNKPYRGKMVKEALCRLTGDKCVGYECQYAGCKINALLPDGKCAKALEKKYKSVSEEELFREMREFEDYDVEDFL